MTAATNRTLIARSGRPQPGNSTSATCIISQAPSTYSAAVRNTRRRRISMSKALTGNASLPAVADPKRRVARRFLE
jgi:hypothetical protein